MLTVVVVAFCEIRIGIGVDCKQDVMWLLRHLLLVRKQCNNAFSARDSGVERLADRSNKLLLRCARALRDSSHG